MLYILPIVDEPVADSGFDRLEELDFLCLVTESIVRDEGFQLQESVRETNEASNDFLIMFRSPASIFSTFFSASSSSLAAKSFMSVRSAMHGYLQFQSLVVHRHAVVGNGVPLELFGGHFQVCHLHTIQIHLVRPAHGVPG